MTLQKLSCPICEHDENLHGENGCAVMIDDIESCPCGRSC